jgi:hypothetical protein
MSIQPAQSGHGWRRLGRQLIGVVAIYALILQSVFLGAAGAPPPPNAAADEGLPAFELCLNGVHNAPLSPTDLPGHQGDIHCIFCFVVAHHFVWSSYFLFKQVDLAIGNVWWSGISAPLVFRPEYSIARPRGPPLSA